MAIDPEIPPGPESGGGEAPDVDRVPSHPPTYDVTLKSGVWTLRRLGRVLLRTRNEKRVDRELQRRASLEASFLGRRVEARKELEGGGTIDRAWDAAGWPEGGAS